MNDEPSNEMPVFTIKGKDVLAQATLRFYADDVLAMAREIEAGYPAGPVAVAPMTEVVDLQAGGTLSLLRFEDGTFRMQFETEGVNLGVPLSPKDVWGIRECIGAFRLADLLEVARHE